MTAGGFVTEAPQFPPPSPLTQLQQEMTAAADPGRAAQMAAYMRDQFDFLGLPKPERARLQRGYLATTKTMPLDRLLSDIDVLWSLPQREFTYVAADAALANVRRFDQQHIVALLPLLDFRPWWDSVDALRKTLGTWLLVRRDRLWPTGGRLLEGSMWQRRVALTAQLQWKEQTDRVFLDVAITRNAGDPEFFIQKAIGWALRDYARTDPGWVSAAIGRHHLTGLARREAAKHLPAALRG